MRNKKINNLVMIFPGQGSQQVGMLSNLASQYPLVKETFCEVSEILNYDIWKLVQSGPVEELNKTYRAQPAILTASVVIWRIWKNNKGCIPQIMAGHSLGEYSALVCAGGIDLFSAAKLVMARGVIMQEAVPYGRGAMSAIIGLDNHVVVELCRQVTKEDKIVSLSSFNAPKNVVISGYVESVNRVNFLCRHAGAKYIFMLPISIPAHCALMKPIVEKFRNEIEKVIIKTPSIPVVNNANICIEQEPEFIRGALVDQLYTPVRWDAVVQYLIQRGIKNFLEMGPGKILTGLIRSNTAGNDDIFALSVNDSISLLKAGMVITRNQKLK